jgi:hypothetical protein
MTLSPYRRQPTTCSTASLTGPAKASKLAGLAEAAHRLVRGDAPGVSHDGSIDAGQRVAGAVPGEALQVGVLPPGREAGQPL